MPTVFLFAISLLAAQSASAIVTVGPAGSGCQFTSIHGIQDAINYVLDKERRHTNDVDPYIGVAGVGGHVYQEALTIDGSNIGSYNVFGTTYDHPFVQIYGDYDGHCNSNSEDGTTAAFLSGQGTGQSVLRVIGNKSVDVVLNHLILYNASLSGNGGGISFESAGLLDLTNVTIQNSQASNGGGVYANGQAPGLEIALHHGTVVQVNTASQAGGGFRLEGITHLAALEDQTRIYDNTAGSFGGGLSLSGYQATADIASTGYSDVPVIYNNFAQDGGGIAATEAATARVFHTAGRGRTGVIFNHAAGRGGGVYLGGIASQRNSKMCAFGFRLDNNDAADGAAIYGEPGSKIGMNEDDFEIDYGLGICDSEAPLPGAADISCFSDAAACNSVSANTASAGATVVSQGLIGELVEFRANSGVRALQGAYVLTNCVIGNNTLTQDVATRVGLFLINCTLAGNSLGAQSPVISGSGVGELLESIVWQPNNRTFDPALGLSNVYLRNVIASDSNLLGSSALFSNVHNYDPAFVNLAQGDFHLRAESPAVDDATPDPTLSPDDDIDGNSRPAALTHAATPLDLGAYELQSLGDVVFSGIFDR